MRELAQRKFKLLEDVIHIPSGKTTFIISTMAHIKYAPIYLVAGIGGQVHEKDLMSIADQWQKN